jgi:two-component system, LytTR family, response regulator
MMINVLIVERSPSESRRVRQLLAEHPDVRVLAECLNGRDALTALSTHDVDLVLVDTRLPDMDAFRVAEAGSPSERPLLAFVSEDREQAARAFDVQAIDYLVKPVSSQHSIRLMGRVRETLAQRAALQNQRQLKQMFDRLSAAASAPVERGARPDPPADGIHRFEAKKGGRTFLVRVEEVRQFTASRNYVRAQTADSIYTFRETLSVLEHRLDPRAFARVNRSAIVRLDAVREVRPWFGGDSILVLDDGSEVKLSRTYRDVVRRLIG